MRRIAVRFNYLLNLKNETFKQAVKYSLVGGLCTLMDFGLLFLFTNYLKINYLTSSVFSFMSGTILNYFLCTFWIFKIRRVKKQHYEFFYYIIITSVGLLFNTLIIWGFTEFWGIFFMFSKIFATFITFWWNFGARKYFLHSIK